MASAIRKHVTNHGLTGPGFTRVGPGAASSFWIRKRKVSSTTTKTHSEQDVCLDAIRRTEDDFLTTSTSTFDGPGVVAPVLTIAMSKEGIRLATRISQGLEAGSSGTSFQSNPVVSALLSMVQHLQYTGTVRTIPDEPSVSQGPPTAIVKPSVDTTKQVAEQINNLAQSLAENVLVGSNNNDPSDYVPTDDEDMAVNNDVDAEDDDNADMTIHVETITGEEADRLLAASDHDTNNDMDSSDPTGTAAICQSCTFYYADQNVIDDPIRADNLPPALPAVIVAESQPGSGTSSQNQQQQIETSSQAQQESETSSQNPMN